MATRPTFQLGLILWALVILFGAYFTVQYFVFGPPQNAVDGIGGGSYALVDQDGNAVDETMFEGHPSLLFFGFTHCPDVCPTTMSDMQYWFAELGDDAEDLKGYFVTVDPERDTPEIIGGYVSWVSERMTGITGSREEIDKIISAWRVVAEKVSTGDGPNDYTMNHTASVFMLDRNGEFVGTIAYGENSDTAIEKIKRLVDRN